MSAKLQRMLDRAKARRAKETAADAILTVLDQEMLHLEQGCNLSNALGQAPRLTGRCIRSSGRLWRAHKDRPA